MDAYKMQTVYIKCGCHTALHFYNSVLSNTKSPMAYFSFSSTTIFLGRALYSPQFGLVFLMVNGQFSC